MTEQEHESDSGSTDLALWKSIKIPVLLSSNNALNKPHRKQNRKRTFIGNRADGVERFGVDYSHC
jgi:hypothetical protein